MDKDPFVLSKDYKDALDLLENTSYHLFITGRAGTGKSTLLRLFRSTTRKKVVVVAPTGVAALNVQGQTIHSFFGFPPRLLQPKDIKKRRFRKLYQKMETLVIDEISMVRADMLDNIDFFLRINREDPRPFGGVQLVFFGDLFQLPPVVSTDVEQQLFQEQYSSPFFFSAKVFESGLSLQGFELKKVYRQDARRFLRLLDAVRLNRADYDDLEELNERYLPHFEPEDFYITLSARNSTVDRINRKELDRIPFPSFTYPAKTTGQFNPMLYPTEGQLKLKEGAQVMFIKNDPEKRFVNGSIGKVVRLETDKIEVQLQRTQQIIDVQPADWEIIKYKTQEDHPDKIETETVGTFEQYPLKLAWAITIHKSQGKTFDKVIIDLGRGAFEHGQTYVALSRCRTLEGIVLKSPLRLHDILVDDLIVDFYEQNFLQ